MMLSHPDGMVEGGVLGDRVLPLVVKLSCRTVNVDVPLRGGVLVALDGSALRLPAEVLGVLGMKLLIQRCIMPMVVGWSVDDLAGTSFEFAWQLGYNVHCLFLS